MGSSPTPTITTTKVNNMTKTEAKQLLRAAVDEFLESVDLEELKEVEEGDTDGIVELFRDNV